MPRLLAWLRGEARQSNPNKRPENARTARGLPKLERPRPLTPRRRSAPRADSPECTEAFSRQGMTEAHRSPRSTTGCAGAADEDEQPDLPEVRRRAQTARGQARLVLRLRELPAVQVHHAVVKKQHETAPSSHHPETRAQAADRDAVKRFSAGLIFLTPRTAPSASDSTPRAAPSARCACPARRCRGR